MSLRGLAGKVWFRVHVFVLDAILRPARPMDMRRLGTYYGGWWVPRVDPTEGVAICAGAGLDVSFDLELARHGFKVYTVDPSPASVTFVPEFAPELAFVPVGLWDSEEELRFVHPDPAYPDHWVAGELAPSEAAASATFEVTTVARLVESIGSPPVAVLKLDVEGAEHRVIRSMLADGVLPRTVCIEFDDRRTARILSTTRRLRAAGYTLLQIENYNYIFTLGEVGSGWPTYPSWR